MAFSKPTRSALVDEETLPLPDQGIDQNSLYSCFRELPLSFQLFLKKCGILKPEGKILFIVPNRRGLWAQSDNNPLRV